MEAFREVLQRGHNVRLELMGKWGDVDLKRELESIMSRRELQGRISLLGEKRDDEKFRHFAKCDIFCFPSFFEAESFGLVLVEAMMFAKPLVSTKWRGIPSVVQDGVNGYTVPVRDHLAVADRLEALIRDPVLRERMGREGRRIFEERFTLERFHQNMEDVLVKSLSHERA